MPGATPTYALPYMLGTDPMHTIDDVTKSLAERLELLVTNGTIGYPGKVNKAGDTMTGNLTISRDSNDTNLVIDSDPGRYSAVTMTSNNSFRWVIRKNTNAEAGTNQGSDFEIMRFDDAGGFLGVAMTINRSNGEAFLYERLTIQPPSSSTLQAIAVIRDDITKSILTGRKDTDAQQRISIRASGEIQLGDGTNARDVFIRRNQAGVLQTDGNLVRAGAVISGANVTVTPDDYLNVATGTTARTFTLPPISGNAGVELVFKNRITTAATNLTIQRQGISDLIFPLAATATVTSVAIAPGNSARFINDGTYWCQI